MAMSAFRRSTAHETKSLGGKGGKGAWYERISIPKNAENATPVLFITGQYQDLNPPTEVVETDPQTGQPKPVINNFFKYKKHRRKFHDNGREQFRDEPCARGPDRHNPQRCAGCMAQEQGDKTVSESDTYVFGLFHLAQYHIHPLIDLKTRQLMMKKDNSGPVMSYSECSGRTCNYCRTLRGEQVILQQNEYWPGWRPEHIQNQFGHRRYMEVGKSHLENLVGFDAIISSQCANPNCRNQLSSEGYACPLCNTLVIDLSTDVRTDAQINDAVLKPYPCLNCQRAVLLKEVVSCDWCAAASRQYRQLSLFESVVWLFKQGEGTKTQIMMNRYQPADEFISQFPPNHLPPNSRPLAQILNEDAKPYDFAEMFKPRSFEEQLKRLGFQAPQTQGQFGQQPQQFGGYGQPPQGQAWPNQGYGQPPQQNVGYPQQQQAPVNGSPQFGGYVPTQSTGVGFPPNQQFQQPAPQQQPPQQQQFYAPYPNQQPAQNGQAAPGPAPFQPTPRPNFGS